MEAQLKTEIAVMQSQMSDMQKSFAEFKSATEVQFTHLERTVKDSHDEAMTAIQNSNKENRQDFASKWVERVVAGLIGAILLTVLYALMTGVLRTSTPVTHPTVQSGVVPQAQAKEQPSVQVPQKGDTGATGPQGAAANPTQGLVPDNVPLLGPLL